MSLRAELYRLYPLIVDSPFLLALFQELLDDAVEREAWSRLYRPPAMTVSVAHPDCDEVIEVVLPGVVFDEENSLARELFFWAVLATGEREVLSGEPPDGWGGPVRPAVIE